MRTLHIKGIEIIDDPKVPDGEIWLLCPMANGGKVRYMFNLTDHRMTQPGEESFFNSLRNWISELGADLDKGEAEMCRARIDLILAAMNEFLLGNDPRTLEFDEEQTQERNSEGVGQAGGSP